MVAITLPDTAVIGDLGHVADHNAIVTAMAALNTKVDDFVVSIEDYGAVGDDATDCTTALQEARAAVLAQGGGTVFIPPGTFRFSSLSHTNSYNKVNYRGAGCKVSILKTTRTDGGSAITYTGVDAPTACAFFTWSDIGLTAVNDTTSGSGFDLTWLGHAGWHNVQVWGFGIHGFKTYEVNTCWFHAVTSEHNKGDGFYLGTNSHANSFTGACAFKNNLGYGLNQQSVSNGCSIGDSFVASSNSLGGIWLTDARAWNISAPYLEGNGVANLIMGGSSGRFPKNITVDSPLCNSISGSTPIGILLQGGTDTTDANQHWGLQIRSPYFNGSYATAEIHVASNYVDATITDIGSFSILSKTQLLKDASGNFHMDPKHSFDILDGQVIGWTAVDGGKYSKKTNPTLIGGAFLENLPRINAPIENVASVIVSGRLTLVAVPLVAGQKITSISFWCGTQAAVAPTNQWFAVYSSALAFIRQTTNDTTTAWNAGAIKTLALTSPYVVPTSGIYYIGVMVEAGTVPSFFGVVSNLNATGGTPKLLGYADTGLTATPPDPAAALSAIANIPYLYLT